MTEPPAELQLVIESWQPTTEIVSGSLDSWRAQALCALLGRAALEQGDELPLSWHQLYLHQVHSMSELGEDGHREGGALMPPLKRGRRMFGGGRITQLKPLIIGETVTRTSSVLAQRLAHGRSGWLLFVTESHNLSVAGEERVREERDIVYRLPTDVKPSSEVTVETVDMRGDSVFKLDVDERMLFSFSALTYNAHRIHYDRPYAVDVERYRSLLIHGPLLAVAAVEAATRGRESRIDSMDFRLVAPAYVDSAVNFDVDDVDRNHSIVTGIQGAQMNIQATVVWSW